MGGCHVFNVLDMLGKKWTVFLLQEIMRSQENGFNQLMRNIKGISPKILSERLTKLEEEKLIEKKVLKQAKATQYYLTEKGKDLIEVLHSLKTYNNKYMPEREQADCLNAASCITCNMLQEEKMTTR